MDRSMRHSPLLLLLVATTACPNPAPQAPATMCFTSRLASSEGQCDVDRDREPNGSLIQATGSGCSPAAGTITVAGAIANRGDVDVYRTGYCGNSSDRKTFTATIDSDLRLCLAVRCAYGKSIVYGASAATSSGADAAVQIANLDNPPDGGVPYGAFRGACRDGNGSITVDFQCITHDTRGEGFIWVDSGDPAGTPICQLYSVAYSLQ
jgi:hypothetical protein